MTWIPPSGTPTIDELVEIVRRFKLALATCCMPEALKVRDRGGLVALAEFFVGKGKPLPIGEVGVNHQMFGIPIVLDERVPVGAVVLVHSDGRTQLFRIT